MATWIRLSFVALLVFTSACSEGRRPFLMAQFCVHDENGVEKLIDEFRRIARSNGMTFIDKSARTQIELEQAKLLTTQLSTNGRAINLAVEGEGGLGMTAGNLGLPRYQIVIGFSAGTDGLASENFSKNVINDLSLHWKVENLDSSQGAKPMQGCK